MVQQDRRMVNPFRNEAHFQATIMELCGHLRLLAYHTHDSRRSQAGFPDLVIVGKQVLFAELKMEKRKLTEPQWEWRHRLQAAGALHVVWRPSDWMDRRIQSILMDMH